MPFYNSENISPMSGNMRGQFNVTYGKYKTPKIFDEFILIAAAKPLHQAQIISADYESILDEHAQRGDAYIKVLRL